MITLLWRHGGMADAPHSKCGGKPCRFKSDCRYHFSQIFGSAFFVVVSGFLVSRRKIDFGIYYENITKMDVVGYENA